MLGGVVKDIGTSLGSRFQIVAWLPLAVFWAALAGLLIAAWGPAAALGWWQSQKIEVQSVLVTAVVVGLILNGLVLSALLDPLIRLFEGYWGFARWGRWLAEPQGVLSGGPPRTVDEPDRQLLADQCPVPAIEPARARDADTPGQLDQEPELHPLVRYQIDAVSVWPRLYFVLPEALVKALGDARERMELMLVISVLGYSFAWIGGLIAAAALPPWAVLICFFTGTALAWIGYEMAVAAAGPYSLLVKVAFDLHRGTLLKVLGLEAPHSFSEERRRWRQVEHLFYTGAPEGKEGAEALGYPRDPEKMASKPANDLDGWSIRVSMAYPGDPSESGGMRDE